MYEDKLKSMFFIQENVAFNFAVTQSIPSLQAMNKWWKLNYVLLNVNKFCINLAIKTIFCEKMTETLAFTWLKHNVTPVGLYENTS